MMTLLDLPPTAVFRRPPEPIERAASIDGDFRWALTRRWSDGPRIAWCGVNPSRADAEIDDPTLWRVMTFSFAWGYGAAVMVNVYPYRTPSPATLQTWIAGTPSVAAEACRINVGKVVAAIEASKLVIAAWGNSVEPAVAGHFMAEVHNAMGRRPTWHCLGRTRSGAPIHPMARGRNRVADTARPIVWSTA